MGDLASGGGTAFSPSTVVIRFPEAALHDYESAVHDVPGGFSSAIISWNADSPPGAWIAVGMRALIGARWTPWYEMGEWSPDLDGGHRRSLSTESDADGRVETDTLVLTRAAHAWQARVVMHAAPDGISPSLRLLAVAVASTSSKSFTPSPSARSSAWGMDLAVPELTQRIAVGGGRFGGGGNSWCSPTSVAMLMAYWARLCGRPDWEISVAAAAAGTYDPVYDGCGNWPFNVAFAAQHGLEGWVALVPGLAELERYIALEVPVIASIRVAPGDLDGAPYSSTAGHLIVVRGFTDSGDVVVNEPYGEAGAIRRIYRREQFERVWQTGSNGAVYLIAPTNRLPA